MHEPSLSWRPVAPVDVTNGAGAAVPGQGCICDDRRRTDPAQRRT